MASEGGRLEWDDVRMRGFTRRTPVAEVWAWLQEHVARLEGEKVVVAEAAGRVLAEDVCSPRDVPPFDRAMMDGYAVRAADTLGATAYNPIRLQVIGQAFPGRPFRQPVGPGQAVQIMTGAPIPEGADAVLPAEMAESEPTTPAAPTRPEGAQVPLAESEPGSVLALGEVPPGKHIGPIGEDIRQGSLVLRAGRLLRPQDVGLLASLGLAEVLVVRQPRVRILVTGDELLPAGAAWQPDHIYDANGPMLQALVCRDGGVPEFWGILPDQPEALLEALQSPSQQPSEGSPRPAKEPLPGPKAQIPDVFLISGGSSVGQEDHAPRILAEHGQLLFHGVAMRPSSPAGLGLWEGRLVFLLPGNPVSCLCAYDFFAGRAIRALAGRSMDWPYRRLTAPLARKVSSMIGRLDYLRVRVVEGRVEPVSISGAGILSTTTQADGFVLIPPESEGYPAGTPVEVFLYDS